LDIIFYLVDSYFILVYYIYLMFGKFFNHSNGSAWWSKARIAFLVSLVLNVGITIYGITQKQNATNAFVGLLVGTAIIYIQTLTASCLKTSKCSILAWLQLLGVIFYILVLAYVVVYGIKEVISQNNYKTEGFEVEEE